MNKNIFYLIIIVLFSACSSGSGGSDNPEPINTIESQIVGKTFWRVLEGPTNNPPVYIPHYFGLEFNTDGNIYTKYCNDTLLTWYENHNIDSAYSIDNTFRSTYSIQDSIIKVNFTEEYLDDDDDEKYWSTLIIDLNSIPFNKYQSLLAYCDYINLNPNTTTIEDLVLSVKVKQLNDNEIDLIWFWSSRSIFGYDINSRQNMFDLHFHEATWKSEIPNCSDYPIFQ
tara:strand:- start:20 stop:697 length:678 start_codon:yes stop_codon:yes gene_type:complete